MDAEPVDRLTIPADEQPSAGDYKRMGRAVEIVERVLGATATICVSPLGPAWSNDVDVYTDDVAAASVRAVAAGWIPLSGIVRHLGFDESAGFAIVDNDQVVAMADLHGGEAPTPVEKAVLRVRRVGEVDARSVLEFRELDESSDLSEVDPQILTRVADAEWRLGGGRLAEWRSIDSQPASVRSRLRWPRISRPSARIAVCGIDGSGKSTLTSGLMDCFMRCGLPATVIWTRPGMGLKHLDRFARLVRHDDQTGLRRLAEGGDATTISSRRGVIGWVWLMLVTVAFLADARSKTRKAEGVVVFDRHLIDALGTVDVLYRGVNSALQKWLIRLLLPRVRFSIWLDVEPELAAARKPDDLIGRDLLEAQFDAYHRHVGVVPGLTRFEVSPSTNPNPVDVFRDLAEALDIRRSGLRGRFFRWIRRLRS